MDSAASSTSILIFKNKILRINELICSMRGTRKIRGVAYF